MVISSQYTINYQVLSFGIKRKAKCIEERKAYYVCDVRNPIDIQNLYL